jgi:hypothetical protein
MHAADNWPPLVRFLGVHLIFGAALAVAFVSLIVLFNVAGLKDLLHEVEDPILPLGALYVLHILTFSSVSMGAAIMLQRDRR